jgi:deoxyribodipyrimidine photo-lyase
MTTPNDRVRLIHDREPKPEGDYVLYWMTAYRRLGWNFALQRAAEEAARLGRPLLILDALGLQYPRASSRFHSFVLDGMLEHDREVAKRRGVFYYSYLERGPGELDGLPEALTGQACLVVTDDYPQDFLPTWVDRARERMDVRLEAVDSNGLVPDSAEERVYSSAFDFRRFVQKTLAPFLREPPLAAPLELVAHLPRPQVPDWILRRWPVLGPVSLSTKPDLTSLPLDQTVKPAGLVGGLTAAEGRLAKFTHQLLDRYDSDRSDPEVDATSGLSPYLHFGHISSHQVFQAVARHEGWHPGLLADTTKGSKQGWWGMSNAAESFLDELVVWRELGFNAAFRMPAFNRFESLPSWARETLNQHQSDTRESLYSMEELETANTADKVWNAAQRQLVEEGLIHNYLRMLWGKRVITWSRTPQEAMDRLLTLNDKYALDGSDPNSVSGIFWCFGRYDRPWPERPVYGRVRTMTSASTVRKFGLNRYLQKYGQSQLS